MNPSRPDPRWRPWDPLDPAHPDPRWHPDHPSRPFGPSHLDPRWRPTDPLDPAHPDHLSRPFGPSHLDPRWRPTDPLDPAHPDHLSRPFGPSHLDPRWRPTDPLDPAHPDHLSRPFGPSHLDPRWRPSDPLDPAHPDHLSRPFGTQFLMLICLWACATYLFLRVMNEADPRWWNRYLALFAATWFCVHTANTETVNYLSSRSDLLSTLAVVLAFCVYLLPAPARRRYWCVIPMAVGALAKSPAVVFAPLLLAYVLLFEERLSGRDLLTRATLPRLRSGAGRAAPAFVAGVAMFLFVESMNGSDLIYSQHSRLGYLMTQPFVWLDYVRLFFMPLGLTADSDWGLLPHWYDTRLFAGLLGLGGLAWLGWRTSTNPATRPVTFGLIWFAAALAPASSFFPLSEVTNGHRTFFPYVGLTLAVVWGARIVVGQWAGARPQVAAVTVGALMAMVLTGNAYGTYVRNRVWLSEESLWSDVVEKSPNNGRAWMNYGLTQMSQGRYARTKELFDHAAVLTPNYSTLEINLGIVNDQLGDQAAAERHFRRALALTPDHSSHFYLARWLVDRAKAPEAIPLLERAIQLSPGFAPPRTLLTNLRYAAGDDLGVQTMISDALAIFPEDPVATAYARGGTPVANAAAGVEAIFARGVELTNQSRHLEAAVAYRLAVRISEQPDGQGWAKAADAWNNLGFSLAAAGLFQEAVPALGRALALRPGFELAANNLAWAQGEVAASY